MVYAVGHQPPVSGVSSLTTQAIALSGEIRTSRSIPAAAFVRLRMPTMRQPRCRKSPTNCIISI